MRVPDVYTRPRIMRTRQNRTNTAPGPDRPRPVDPAAGPVARIRETTRPPAVLFPLQSYANPLQ